MHDIQSIMDVFLEIFEQYRFNVIVTFTVIVLNIVISRGVIPRIKKYINHSRLKKGSLDKAKTSLKMLSNLISIALILFIWGFDFNGLMTMSAGLIALLGVSLFAGWSILSNVTAFFLLIFHESYKRGNFIRVISIDNYIEGYIAEINLFNTRLITEDKEVVVYPNILLMSNPAVINPRARYGVIGKITDFDTVENKES